MSYEIPPVPSGSPEEQIEGLWRYLFRLIEKMNVESPENGGTAAAGTTDGFSVAALRELREMIGGTAKKAGSLEKDKVSHTELQTELEKKLREAEESGAFDGNGIASASMDEEYRLRLEFTDGTYYTTPSLRGAPVYEVGDVYVTTRAGAPEELLGYGEWEQIASSPAFMWERIS